jgi:Redoxin/Copper type II ascorbate-dependent monooxygenase, C-terminal domain/EF hand
LKNYLIPAVFIAGALLCALRGFAQQSPAAQALELRFKQLDKNGDGKITTDEVPQSPFFQQRDKNGDGVITLAEARAALEAGVGVTPGAVAAKPKEPISTASKSQAESKVPTVRQRPRPLVAGDHGVGRMVADVSLTDLTGASRKLSSFSKQRAVVIAMTSTSCPLSKKYLPTLSNLASLYSQRGVTWVLVNPMATDKSDDIQMAANTVEGNAIYVLDRKGDVAKVVGALTTTDIVVLDASRTVVFHGAIDDQYGFGYALDAPRQSYLADAIEAVLANKRPRVAATDAPGCALELLDSPSAEVALTYHNRISRIVQTNCVECHRDGGVAPFALTSHADVTAHAAMIKQVVEAGTMPPWFAASPEKGEERKSPSVWANDRSLADTEKKDLFAWVDGGKQEGDERDAPQPRSFKEGWLIGKPDAVFKFPQPVPVKATGTIPYQNIVVETNLGEDKWVQAIEVQPGNRSVVHHMTIFLLSADKERASAADVAGDERIGFWAIYVPGNSTLIYPDGFGRYLPKNAKLRCQVHYTTNGTATTDSSRIGVVFAKQPPQHEVRVVGISNPRMAIPAGAENHREEGSLRLPFDIEVLSFLPHMHLRAKACRFRVIGANGESRTLLDVPRYDFNWQLLYRYSQPLKLSRGDLIKFTAWYDNSPSNPANPDPTQIVRWGLQTSDEMHLGYVEYFIPGLRPGEPVPDASAER